MIKRTVGALVGALCLALIVPLAGLLLGWLALEGSLGVAAMSAAGGAVLGWLRPGLFLNTVLFFLEPSVFD